MKNIFILLLLLISSLSGYAQRVDLDRFSFPFSVQRLPIEPIPLDKRTYGVRANVGGSIKNFKDQAAVYDMVQIAGWQKVENSPTVGVSINLDDFNNSDNSAKVRTEEIKDKDGKVTSTVTYYFYEMNFYGVGSAKIDGPVTPRKLTEKEIEAKKQKEEAKANNRFLAKVATSTTTLVAETGVNLNLNFRQTLRTPEYRNAEESRREFDAKRASIYDTGIRNYVNKSIDEVVNYLNSTYGYREVKGNDMLWIINSKSHPEYETQREAIQAVKVLFSTMTSTQPIDELRKNMEPLIDYFQSLKTKYNTTDKADKKVRYSAFYNLAKIYHFLDMPEQAIKEAEGLANNDYDAQDAAQLIESSKSLLEDFNRLKVNSRHIPPFNSSN